MQTIYLDISNKGVIPTIYAKQGDVGREFLVILTDAGVPYNPPGGSVFSVWYNGSSGEGNYTDVGTSSAFVVSANTVRVELITQMLQNEGSGNLCLMLNRENGDQISSWNISYVCEAVPGYESEEAKSYFTAFSDAVKNLPYPDTSLSAPGKAADAAATGKALEGKAPAGYGLGVRTPRHISSVEELDLITDSGWYSLLCDSGLYITPGYFFAYGWMRVDSYGEGVCTQTIRNISSESILMRQYISAGGWGEWEWVNPPMVQGVEYRTTKRWNGKAVYIQLFDCGALPNNTSKTTTLTVTKKTIVDVNAVAVGSSGTYKLPALNEADVGNKIAFWNMGTSMVVKTFGSGWGPFNLYVTLKYTKD